MMNINDLSTPVPLYKYVDDSTLFEICEFNSLWASVKFGDTLGMLIWLETINGMLCYFGGNTDK